LRTGAAETLRTGAAETLRTGAAETLRTGAAETLRTGAAKDGFPTGAEETLRIIEVAEVDGELVSSGVAEAPPERFSAGGLDSLFSR
jgi:hypothetical protein